MTSRFLTRAAPLIAALALGACAQENTGDAPPPGGSSLSGATFLLFPNPQVQADGSLQTNSVAYAQAYYAAIDPDNERDTLARWKSKNKFDDGIGTQVEVVFGDVRDLGYGRRLIARWNPVDGTIAAIVENYMVNTVVDYTFTGLNLDAAVQRVPRWHDNTNAIEFSPGKNGGPSFVKFFQFNPDTGARELTVNIDGRGQKAMPGPCLACHGGRADALTPTGLFPVPGNLATSPPTAVQQRRGDTQGRMMPLEVGTFSFPATPGFTRADQEAKLKMINAMVLCTYPGAGACAGLPVGATRPAVVAGEWQGTAAELIEAAYGGPTLPNAVYSDTFVPGGWVGQEPLYQGVVAPTCRACHIVRGTSSQADVDLHSFAKFLGFAARTKAHVFDRGNMPLAKLPFEDFWSTGKAEILASFLEGLGQGFVVRDSAGALLRPGRPVADPGPARTITQGATTLSAAGSLFATTYSWSVVSGPNGAVPPTNFTLTNPDSVQPTFSTTAISGQAYVLQLVVGNGTVQSTPAQLTLVVSNAPTLVGALRFSSSADPTLNIKPVCGGCHNGVLPIRFGAALDRNGDAIAGDATDDQWFYTELRSRINFADIVASPLLRKPSGLQHGAGPAPITGFDIANNPTPGQPGRAEYDQFLNWILNGAPM